MLIPFAVCGQIALDVRLERDLAIGSAGNPQIGDPAMPQAVERLVGVFDAGAAMLIAEPCARQVRGLPGPLAVAIEGEGRKQRPVAGRL